MTKTSPHFHLTPGTLYLDTATLTKAYKSGGPELLNVISRYAQEHNLKISITDVVATELHGKDVIENRALDYMDALQNGEPINYRGNPARDIQGVREWIDAQTDLVIDMTETGDRRLGLSEPSIGEKNAGEISISEKIVEDMRAGNHSIMVTEDHRFLQSAHAEQFMDEVMKAAADVEAMSEVRGSLVVNDFVYSNLGFLANALHDNTISPDEYNQLGQAITEFEDAEAKRSGQAPADNQQILSPDEAIQVSEGTNARSILSEHNIKIIGALGETLAVAGTVLLAIDALTTVAHAADSIESGDAEEAKAAVDDFSERVGSALMGAEIGAAGGALAAGPAGALIGSLAGAVLGEATMKDALHQVNDALHPENNEQSLPPDGAAIDSAPANPEEELGVSMDVTGTIVGMNWSSDQSDTAAEEGQANHEDRLGEGDGSGYTEHDLQGEDDGRHDQDFEGYGDLDSEENQEAGYGLDEAAEFDEFEEPVEEVPEEEEWLDDNDDETLYASDHEEGTQDDLGADGDDADLE